MSNSVCIRCGARRVTPRQGLGRTCSYRIFPTLPVPESVEIPTCGRCRAQYIDLQTAATLEPVLSAVYKKELTRRARQAIGSLSIYISQAELERLADISQGYLSRVYRGPGTPSPQLVALLALLAQDPSLLTWLSRYWAEPCSPPCRPHKSVE